MLSRITIDDPGPRLCRVRDDATALSRGSAMVAIREEMPVDVAPREKILDACFGPFRWQKTCERLRAGRRATGGLSLVADLQGELAGTVRLWHVRAGTAGRALLLGPLAVDCSVQGAGIGAALMREALTRAARLGHGAVLLVGDAPYYERFGFSADLTAALTLPGPFERGRFLGLELVPGALARARGPVTATGERETKPAPVAPVRVAAIDQGPQLAA